MSKLGHLSLVKVLEEKNGKNEHVFQWPRSRSRSQFRLEKTKLPLRNSRVEAARMSREGELARRSAKLEELKVAPVA